LVTVLSDKRIVFWDSFNGSVIRELESLLNAQPNSIHISPNGRFFVTGGDEKLVKVWDFQTGGIIATGRGHCTNIKQVSYSRMVRSSSPWTPRAAFPSRKFNKPLNFSFFKR
jgi:WD40 repeat protein